MALSLGQRWLYGISLSIAIILAILCIGIGYSNYATKQEYADYEKNISDMVTYQSTLANPLATSKIKAALETSQLSPSVTKVNQMYALRGVGIGMVVWVVLLAIQMGPISSGQEGNNDTMPLKQKVTNPFWNAFTYLFSLIVASLVALILVINIYAKNLNIAKKNIKDQLDTVNAIVANPIANSTNSSKIANSQVDTDKAKRDWLLSKNAEIQQQDQNFKSILMGSYIATSISVLLYIVCLVGASRPKTFKLKPFDTAKYAIPLQGQKRESESLDTFENPASNLRQRPKTTSFDPISSEQLSFRETQRNSATF